MLTTSNYPATETASLTKHQLKTQQHTSNAANIEQAHTSQNHSAAQQQFQLVHINTKQDTATTLHVITPHNTTLRGSITTAESAEHYFDALDYFIKDTAKSSHNHTPLFRHEQHNTTAKLESLKKTIDTTKPPTQQQRSTTNNYDAKNISSVASIETSETDEVFYDASDFFTHATQGIHETFNPSTTELEKTLEHNAQKINWQNIQLQIRDILGDQFAALANPQALLQLVIANTIASTAGHCMGLNMLPMLYLQLGTYTISTALTTLLNTLHRLEDISLNQYLNSLQLVQTSLKALPYLSIASNIFTNFPYGGIVNGASLFVSSVASHLVKPLVETFTPKLANYATQLLGYLKLNNPQQIASKLTYAISAGASSGIVQTASILVVCNQFSSAAMAASLRNHSNITVSPSYSIITNDTTIPTLNSSAALTTTAFNSTASSLASNATSFSNINPSNITATPTYSIITNGTTFPIISSSAALTTTTFNSAPSNLAINATSVTTPTSTNNTSTFNIKYPVSTNSASTSTAPNHLISNETLPQPPATQTTSTITTPITADNNKLSIKQAPIKRQLDGTGGEGGPIGGNEPPTTNAPTTNAPTTNAPTTDAPTTNAPTTDAPTTNAPTTNAPTTNAPTTEGLEEATTTENINSTTIPRHIIVSDYIIGLPFRGFARRIDANSSDGLGYFYFVPGVPENPHPEVGVALPENICDFLISQHDPGSYIPLDVTNATNQELASLYVSIVDANNITRSFGSTYNRYYFTTLVKYNNESLLRNVTTQEWRTTFEYSIPNYVLVSKNVTALDLLEYNGAPRGSSLNDSIGSTPNQNIFAIPGIAIDDRTGYAFLPCIERNPMTRIISSSQTQSTFLAPSTHLAETLVITTPISTLLPNSYTQVAQSTLQPSSVKSTHTFTSQIIYTSSIHQSNTTTIAITPTSSIDVSISDTANEKIPAWTVPVTVIGTAMIILLTGGTACVIVKRRTIISLFTSKWSQIHPNNTIAETTNNVTSSKTTLATLARLTRIDSPAHIYEELDNFKKDTSRYVDGNQLLTSISYKGLIDGRLNSHKNKHDSLLNSDLPVPPPPTHEPEDEPASLNSASHSFTYRKTFPTSIEDGKFIDIEDEYDRSMRDQLKLNGNVNEYLELIPPPSHTPINRANSPAYLTILPPSPIPTEPSEPSKNSTEDAEIESFKEAEDVKLQASKNGDQETKEAATIEKLETTQPEANKQELKQENRTLRTTTASESSNTSGSSLESIAESSKLLKSQQDKDRAASTKSNTLPRANKKPSDSKKIYQSRFSKKLNPLRMSKGPKMPTPLKTNNKVKDAPTPVEPSTKEIINISMPIHSTEPQNTKGQKSPLPSADFNNIEAIKVKLATLGSELSALTSKLRTMTALTTDDNIKIQEQIRIKLEARNKLHERLTEARNAQKDSSTEAKH